jgi:sulfite exporter TauE/SafE
MTSLLIAAFIMGSIGSVHCIGMCGPLALSLPVVTNDHTSRFISTLLYNAGRVFTYACLGAIFGMIGMSFAFFGYQQWLSVLLGVTIIFFIVLPKKYFQSSKNNTVIRFFENIRLSLGRLFSKRKYHSVFSIGLLNGLLPCGLVYIAIAAAVSTASVVKSSLFMASFGLGTLPVMWSIAFFGSSINMNIRLKIRKMYPYVMLLMAILLIIRGLGLEIPYMSPVLNQDQGSVKQEIICHD